MCKKIYIYATATYIKRFHRIATKGNMCKMWHVPKRGIRPGIPSFGALPQGIKGGGVEGLQL